MRIRASFNTLSPHHPYHPVIVRVFVVFGARHGYLSSRQFFIFVRLYCLG